MTGQPPPLPPQYGLPPPWRERQPSFVVQFVVAFFAGIGLSLLAWYSGSGAATRLDLGWLVWGIVVLKLSGGITLVCFRGLRGYGAGLLASLPIGVMIFIVSACSNMH